MKKIYLFFSFLACALLLQAQAPAGYYAKSKGAKGAGLKTALYGIIANPDVSSYKQLWEDFKTTDVRPDGKIWDMYSNKTNYTPGGSAQGANYSKEGDSYNREHSFPKSWFNDAKPMYSDLFHLYPTDGYVNNRRSNYPFGETDGDIWTSNNSFSKLGKSTLKGYSGTVFEPADEYKGDFARTYFYMATAYETQIAGWDSPMLANNEYPAYTDWAIEMLLRWAAEDPVSEKEVNRNNAVYGIQNNRNPYIDFPGLEQYVWGNSTSVAFDPDNYNGAITPPEPGDPEVEAPVFSPSGGSVLAGTEVSISCATDEAVIFYTINDANEASSSSDVSFTVNESTTVSAYALLGTISSDTVTATFTVTTTPPAGTDVYQLVTNAASLEPGKRLLVICPEKEMALSAQGNNIRSNVSITLTDATQLTTDVNAEGLPYSLILGGTEDNWTLFDETGKVYLALTVNDNKLNTANDANSDNALWRINITNDGVAEIFSKAYPERLIKYNVSSPRFACYRTSSTMKPVALFESLITSGISSLKPETEGAPSVVTTIDGRIVRHAATVEEALKNLPRGIYIINGKKILIGK